MADVFTRERRSEIMSRVRGKENAATELKMIGIFKENKITGWRRNYKAFGKPDFVFPKKKIAIFVDGEFWHGHPTRAKIPETNRDFWEKKIARNKKRDRLVNKTLKDQGWTVIRVWQRDISDAKTLKKIALVLDQK